MIKTMGYLPFGRTHSALDEQRANLFNISWINDQLFTTEGRY